MDQCLKNKECIDNRISKIYEGLSLNWRTLGCGLGQILLSCLKGESLDPLWLSGSMQLRRRL